MRHDDAVQRLVVDVGSRNRAGVELTIEERRDLVVGEPVGGVGRGDDRGTPEEAAADPSVLPRPVRYELAIIVRQALVIWPDVGVGGGFAVQALPQ